MSGEQEVCRTEEIKSTLKIMMCESDKKFFHNLYEFIEQEKRYLQCPEEGPDELRYFIYRSVFNKVIGRTTDYKRLLLNIKSEYDDTIRELKRREEEAIDSQWSGVVSTSNQQSVVTCQRRATLLRERISVLQTQTTEIQKEMRRRKSKNQRSQIPGLSEAESEDPEALQRHLKHLETQRSVLLDRKSQCVPLEVQTELEAELQAAEHHRDQLSSTNKQLMILFKRLRFVVDSLTCWDQAGQKVPLEEVLGSTLQNIQHVGSESNTESDDDFCSIDVELFEDEEPTGVDESKLLKDHLDRFVELFKSARYEEAALHAARSPRGVLRNSDTMEMFKGVQTPTLLNPPALLFFQALLVTVATGDRLSGDVSLQGVGCSLQHGNTQLVTHAITQNKLTFTEELGDVLTEHAQKSRGVSDLCLALATIGYEACRVERKTALSMCRRGLIHSAAEFMKQNLTADDCMWVLSQSASLSLLQLLTDSSQSQAVILPVGGACTALLADPQHHQLVLQLLDSFLSRGQDVLENIILEDSNSSVDIWDQVASLCSDLNRGDLSRVIRFILLCQSGTGVQSPDPEGARLMEHVFL